MPSVYDADHLGLLVASLAEKEEKILICRADKGSRELTRNLEQAGISYMDFPLYELKADREKRREAVRNAAEADYLLFGSASGVETFRDGLLEECTVRLEPGNAEIAMEPTPEGRAKAEAVMEMLRAGAALLEEMYGQYVVMTRAQPEE